MYVSVDVVNRRHVLRDFCFQVKDMTSRLRTTFIDNLKSADWMDDDTKQAAKEKV